MLKNAFIIHRLWLINEVRIYSAGHKVLPFLLCTLVANFGVFLFPVFCVLVVLTAYITAIPKLLQLLDIEGSIIRIDAIGTQTDIAELIIDQKADYIQRKRTRNAANNFSYIRKIALNTLKKIHLKGQWLPKD